MPSSSADVEIITGIDLPAPALAPDCPCGWDWGRTSRRTHADRHLEWATGVPVPAALARPWPSRSIAVVHLTSPVAWRQATYRVAQLAQRAGGHDVASFPRPYGPGRDDREHTRAFLYRDVQTVVGYLVAGDSPTAGRHHLTSGTANDTDRGRIRTTVGLVFVAANWRRRRIGSALVRTAAQHASVPTRQLARWTPFTEDGAALARSFADTDGGVWVA